MPGSKDPNVIDGLSSIRAVRRAGESGQARPFKTRPSQERLPGPAKGNAPRNRAPTPASRIGHTVMPQKHELLCYECGYAFVITGIIHYPICPKCHRKLVMDDLCVDGEWTGNVRTIGNVEIKSGGVVTSGSITARDIIIEGNAEQCELHAGRRLELGGGARFDPGKTHFKDVRIRPGARITIRQELVCRDLLIEGELKATIVASGMVSVRPGGFLRGIVRTAHLAVEEGGGVKATLRVAPGAELSPSQPADKPKNKRETKHGDKTRIGARPGRAHQ